MHEIGVMKTVEEIYYSMFNGKYRLTIIAGGMQTMRAIIEM